MLVYKVIEMLEVDEIRIILVPAGSAETRTSEQSEERTHLKHKR